MANIWKNLGTSSVGDKLVNALQEKQEDIRDCANWEEGEDKHTAMHASRAIEDIIKKIQKNNPKSSNPNEGSGPNQWE